MAGWFYLMVLVVVSVGWMVMIVGSGGPCLQCQLLNGSSVLDVTHIRSGGGLN